MNHREHLLAFMADHELERFDLAELLKVQRRGGIANTSQEQGTYINPCQHS